VIGLGGGSVLDAAKAISGLMTNGGDALDYVEIVGRGREMESPAAPFLAIPTTAGTGSEATKNAVLTEPRARVKVSMRSPLLLPAAALVDPELTFSLPVPLTASTGLDALTQLLEAAVGTRATPMTDLFALDGIARSARSLARALRDPGDAAAREDLALASLYGGLALANAGLGAVHGIAAPLGGRHPVPHGVACAVLLPHVFETNLRALRERDPGGAGLARIARASEVLVASWRDGDGDGGAADETDGDAPDAAAALLHRLVASCRLPGLSSFGVGRADILPLAEASLRASSMKGNPVALSSAEIEAAIAAAL
jgi:alcohol dehydrogenase class IV